MYVRGDALLPIEQSFVARLGEKPQMVKSRLRSLGCSPCTGAIIGGQSGAIQINGSGFAPGGVLWSCIGSLCGGDTLSQGTNPSMIGFNAAFEGSTYDPGWYDYRSEERRVGKEC